MSYKISITVIDRDLFRHSVSVVFDSMSYDEALKYAFNNIDDITSRFCKEEPLKVTVSISDFYKK